MGYSPWGRKVVHCQKYLFILALYPANLLNLLSNFSSGSKPLLGFSM